MQSVSFQTSYIHRLYLILRLLSLHCSLFCGKLSASWFRQIFIETLIDIARGINNIHLQSVLLLWPAPMCDYSVTCCAICNWAVNICINLWDSICDKVLFIIFVWGITQLFLDVLSHFGHVIRVRNSIQQEMYYFGSIYTSSIIFRIPWIGRHFSFWCFHINTVSFIHADTRNKYAAEKIRFERTISTYHYKYYFLYMCIFLYSFVHEYLCVFKWRTKCFPHLALAGWILCVKTGQT